MKFGTNIYDDWIAAGLSVNGVVWLMEEGKAIVPDDWSDDLKAKVDAVIAAHVPGEAAPPPKSWERVLDFKLEFLPEERVAMREFGKLDVMAEDFLDLLNSATRIVASDPLLIQGLQYMVANDVLDQERVDEILGLA